jgi:hypothetical protein
VYTYTEKEKRPAGKEGREDQEDVMNKMISGVIAVLTVMLAVFTVSLSISPKWSVQRRIYVNARPERVMEYVDTTAAFKKWNEWVKKSGFDTVTKETAKENMANYIVYSKETGLKERSTVMILGADYGSYVIMKVEGTSKSSPLTRYLLLLHNRVFGDELSQDLTVLKKEIEKN